MPIKIELTGTVTGLEEAIAKLQQENYDIRENCVTHEVYMRAIAERDEARELLYDVIEVMDTKSCSDCKYSTPNKDSLPCSTCGVWHSKWEWKHLDEIKEILGI